MGKCRSCRAKKTTQRIIFEMPKPIMERTAGTKLKNVILERNGGNP
jgi:hypothetical protein